MPSHRITHSVIPAVAAALLSFSAPSIAANIFVDFESPPGSGYDLFNGAAQVTTQAHSPTHSAELNDPVNGSTVRIIQSGNLLGNTQQSFWAYIPTGSNTSLAPYGIFGVDVNKNGLWDTIDATGDALVIAFITGTGSYPADTWFQTGLDAATEVHVVGNRAGLAPGRFSSSGHIPGDTLAALALNPTGAGTEVWGDLSLLRAYVEIGEWPGISTYDSFVDDIAVRTVSAVPEPSTLALLAGAFMIVLRSGQRKRRLSM